MRHADLAVELFTTEDPVRARDLARQINDLNAERQQVERATVDAAKRLVEEQGGAAERGAIVVGAAGWHHGVIGIVASRLVEIYHRPTIVVTFGEELAQGSGRSISGFNLYEALQACADDLVTFGGHAAAAGVRLRPDRFAAFAERFEAHCRSVLTPDRLMRSLTIDAEVRLDALTRRALDEIARLEPHGAGNPKPLLVANDCEVVGSPRTVGSDQAHLKFRVRQGNAVVGAIAFGMAERLKRLQSGSFCSLAFHPKWNDHFNHGAVELEICDVVFDEETGDAGRQSRVAGAAF